MQALGCPRSTATRHHQLNVTLTSQRRRRIECLCSEILGDCRSVTRDACLGLILKAFKEWLSSGHVSRPREMKLVFLSARTVALAATRSSYCMHLMSVFEDILEMWSNIAQSVLWGAVLSSNFTGSRFERFRSTLLIASGVPDSVALSQSPRRSVDLPSETQPSLH